MGIFPLKFKGIGVNFTKKIPKLFKIMKPIKSRTGYEKALGTVEAIGKFETKLNQIILGYSR